MSSLALLAFAALTQELPAVSSASPHDRSEELVLVPDAGGAGASASDEYRVDFTGRLYVRTFSKEIDVHLELLDARGTLLVEDRDDGPEWGTGASLAVEPGASLLAGVTALGSGATSGSLRLEWIAAPESEATRTAAALGRRLVEQANALSGGVEADRARALLAQAFDELTRVEGSSASSEITAALAELANAARLHGDVLLLRSATSLVHARFERTLPADHPARLHGAQNMANALNAAGDPSAAKALQEEVLEARERTLPPNHPDLLNARVNQSIIESATGDLNAMRARLEDVLEAYEASLPGDHPDVLDVRLNLGTTIAKLGDLAGARAIFESVLAACERSLPEDHPEVLMVRQNLAVTLRELGDLRGARALEEEVLSALERALAEGHPQLLAARTNLASTLHRMGEFAAARRLQEQVLAACESGLPADHPERLSAELYLAVTRNALGEHDDARAAVERVLRVRADTLPADHPELLATRNIFAGMCLEGGNLSAARELFADLLETRERTLPADDALVLGTRHNLAVTCLWMGDSGAVRELVDRQVAGLTLRTRSALGLSPREARDVIGIDAPWLSLALLSSESADAGAQRALFELIETRRLAGEETVRATEWISRRGSLRKLAKKAHEARAGLNDLVAGAGSGAMAADAFAAELARLSGERDNAQRALAGALAERGIVADGISTDALAAALPAGGAAVGFLRYERWRAGDDGLAICSMGEHLLAHVLRSDGTLRRVELGPAGELEELVTAWRAQLGSPVEARGLPVVPSEPSSVTAADVGMRLRERILDPLLLACGEGVSTLFVCPDDLVHLVPLDALPYEGDLIVGDRLRIVVQPSFARLQEPQGATRGEPSLLALGGVDYGAPSESESAVSEERPTDAGVEAFPSLPETRAEALAIGALFREALGRDGSVLESAAASKAAFAEALRRKRYVHLATHGWFAPDAVPSMAVTPADSTFPRTSLEERVRGFAPMTLCGLALAGANRGRDSLGRVPGILTAEELSSLDLSDCRLAVLSACDTNVGLRRAGQGIQSLQTALHAAGARSAITSLWKVDDAATRELMERFYTYLWLEELPVADALWRAKNDLRRAGHPPRDWAGWILSGDPR